VNGKLEVTRFSMFASTWAATYDVFTASSVTGSCLSSSGRLAVPQLFLRIEYDFRCLADFLALPLPTVLVGWAASSIFDNMILVLGLRSHSKRVSRSDGPR